MPGVLGAVVVVVVFAVALVSVGVTVIAKGRAQRSADLIALSAAGVLHEERWRVGLSNRPDGTPNPLRLSPAQLASMTRAAARTAARRNGVPPRTIGVHLIGYRDWAPSRVRVTILAEAELGARDRRTVEASAVAEAVPDGRGLPTQVASGGGYSGPLAIRQGEGMRPDVARAFDRMAAAAERAGMLLAVTSGFRSDAEQAVLFAQNPDPRWVAPPGRSLHRCATELDLGPPSVHSWLAANAPRFGFIKRYSWEPWHFGYVDGPEPCSSAGRRAHRGGGLPVWVPPAYRGAILRSAAKNGVSAVLLAAQLSAESGFNPRAVSRAGAIGIAQFMPATARSVGLADAFDPEAAIDAQGRLMAQLIARFGSPILALAAYNAGPSPVAACGCVPPYPETRAYVAQISGLLSGTGAGAAGLGPAAPVRLVA